MPTWVVPASAPSVSVTSVFAALPSGLPCAPWLPLTPGASLGSSGDWEAQPLSCPSSPAPCLLFPECFEISFPPPFFNPEGGVDRRQAQGTWGLSGRQGSGSFSRHLPTVWTSSQSPPIPSICPCPPFSPELHPALPPLPTPGPAKSSGGPSSSLSFLLSFVICPQWRHLLNGTVLWSA